MFTHFGDNLSRLLGNPDIMALFLQGAGYTLLLSTITVFFGILLGSLLALLRGKRRSLLNLLVSAYVELVRGTPLLLQLYLFYYVMPGLLPFLNLSKFASVSLALALNSAAYVSEIVRAGIQAVEPGQAEAARSLGMSSVKTMLHIILPQAIKNILPALGNEFVTVIKETSLASTFFIGDLMTQYNVVRGRTFLALEPLVLVGAIYFLLTFSLSKLINRFERKLKASD